MAKAGVFIAVDRCAKHGFAMLCVMTLDENECGGGTRLLGPKSCCPLRREVERWRVSTEQLREIVSALETIALDAPAAPEAHNG